jgi:predicted Zn-dependent protease
MTRVLCALAFVAAATSMRAQEIRRPRLDAKADTNDWEAYYDFGVENLQRFPSRAYDAFYWAARLAPWSGDPLYAQWVAFHLRDVPRFERYLDDDQKVLAARDVRAADSTVSRAFLRNPFAISQTPDKFHRFRHIRAVLFVMYKQYDSALTEVQALLAKAREVDESERALVREYESKAFYEFAIGQLETARGNPRAAREALERALIEDLAYGPAHVALGALSEVAGQREAALASYAQAVDLSPGDAVYRYRYAVALLKADRPQDALGELNRAIALEPYYAESYVFKAGAHETLGQADSARVAYRAYLARAARNGQNRGLATRRLAALEGQSPN